MIGKSQENPTTQAPITLFCYGCLGCRGSGEDLDGFLVGNIVAVHFELGE